MPIPAALPLSEPDVPALAEVARAGLTELPGCHRYRFDLERDIDLPLVGKEREAYTGEMMLRDGVWSAPTWSVVLDESPGSNLIIGQDGREYPFVLPMLGRHEGDDGSFRNLLGEVVDGLGADTESLWVEADSLEGQPVYKLLRSRDVAARRRDREVLTSVWIPPGSAHARRWVATLEKPIYLDGDSGPRMDDVTVDLAVDADGLPTSERVAARLMLGPFRVRMDQRTRYTLLEPCAVAP